MTKKPVKKKAAKRKSAKITAEQAVAFFVEFAESECCTVRIRRALYEAFDEIANESFIDSTDGLKATLPIHIDLLKGRTGRR